jgi:flagella basal body P-ring formation protein FlgA
MRRTLLVTLLLIPARVEGRVASAVEVDGPRVRLSDLVGPVQSDVDLGDAPRPGRTRRINRRKVLLALGRQPSSDLGRSAPARGGASPLPSARSLPRYFQVATRYQIVSCQRQAQLAAEALQPLLPDGLEVKSLHCARPLRLPVGDIRVTASMPSTPAPAGRVNVTLRYNVGQWPAEERFAAVAVDGEIAVAVAARQLEAGALVASAARWQRRTASTLPSDAVTGPEQLAGMKLNRALRSGTLIRRAHLTPIPLVRRGAAVTVATVLQGLRVSTRGVARQDGRRGETILVQGQDARRLIKARVVSAHLVVVDL